LRTLERSNRIDYRRIDLTNEEELATLGTARFDAAVCNMGLMDIASVTPLLRATFRALKTGGRFVFSVLHPCFNTNGTTLLAERDDYDGCGLLRLSVRISCYLNLVPQKGVEMEGQPEPHFFFHRPFHTLLGACFAAGLVLDGLEEPAFDNRTGDFALRWGNCVEIPPILVARLRKVAAP
jgi:SAM-dependent methyltransferase